MITLEALTNLTSQSADLKLISWFTIFNTNVIYQVISLLTGENRKVFKLEM